MESDLNDCSTWSNTSQGVLQKQPYRSLSRHATWTVMLMQMLMQMQRLHVGEEYVESCVYLIRWALLQSSAPM
jgi:hypothetical protein